MTIKVKQGILKPSKAVFEVNSVSGREEQPLP
ncbi:MAG: hypothetical protein GDYSWBUE_001333 [Candidatus Fervidibacterota bacterium]